MSSSSIVSKNIRTYRISLCVCINKRLLSRMKGGKRKMKSGLLIELLLTSLPGRVSSSTYQPPTPAESRKKGKYVSAANTLALLAITGDTKKRRNIAKGTTRRVRVPFP